MEVYNELYEFGISDHVSIKYHFQNRLKRIIVHVHHSIGQMAQISLFSVLTCFIACHIVHVNAMCNIGRLKTYIFQVQNVCGLTQVFSFSFDQFIYLYIVF